MAGLTGRATADVLVAVDVGTSGARAVAFDLDGRRLVEIRRAYPTREPRPGWAEQSPADWRSASLASIAELVRRLGSGERVRAISLTGQCPSVVLVFRQVGDHAVGGQHHAGDRRGVLQRGARDLAGIEDAHLHQVAVFARKGVEPEAAFTLLHAVEHH